MFIFKSYEIPLYQGSRKSCFNVVFSDKKNWHKVAALIQSHDDNPHEIFEYEAVAAFATYTESAKSPFHVWAVFTDQRFSANTAAHEAVHVVNYIFRSRGIQADLQNDEPQAYLTGWVHEKIYQSIPRSMHKMIVK